MTLDVDAVVIGAGPAGMACSEVLARHNANVVVLDEQNAPGGQIYKNIEGVVKNRPADIIGYPGRPSAPSARGALKLEIQNWNCGLRITCRGGIRSPSSIK